MQVEFQQSSLYAWMVPQIQFIDKVLQPPVCDGGVYPQCKLCRRPMRSHRCCSWCVYASLLYNDLLGRDSEGSAVAVFSQVVDVPVVQVVVVPQVQLRLWMSL